MYQQKLFSAIALTTVLTVYCVPGMAKEQTWAFDRATQSFTSAKLAAQSIGKSKKNGKILELTSSEGVRLKMSSLSDTKEVSGGDDEIRRSKLSWADSDALGAKNKDEKKELIKSETKSEIKAHRGIDSVVTRTGDKDGNFDMLLLEFDTAVSLDGLTLDWARGGDADKKTADISILAYTGDGSFDLLKNTWANALGSGDGNAFDVVGNYSSVDLSYFAVNPNNVTSTKWLIGVYNPVFGAGGDAGDDAFRLASIETSTPTEEPKEVPVPGTLALLLAGLLALSLRRRVSTTLTKAAASELQKTELMRSVLFSELR